MKLKIPWRKVAATAWEWAQIIWKAKHPTDKPPTPPVVPALLLVAALATLAPPCRAQGPDSINVAGVVERQIQRAPWQALCVIRWKDRAPHAFDVLDVTPAPDSSAEMARCGGYPVMLVRPVCLVTLKEALYYTDTAPAVLIRCAPHAQMLRNPLVPYPTRQLERA